LRPLRRAFCFSPPLQSLCWSDAWLASPAARWFS
jgi:hypothetical protein